MHHIEHTLPHLKDAIAAYEGNLNSQASAPSLGKDVQHDMALELALIEALATLRLSRHDADVQLFPKPSENVRGVSNLQCELNGKSTTIGKATLLVDESPEISFKLPSKVKLEEVPVLIASMASYYTELKRSMT